MKRTLLLLSLVALLATSPSLAANSTFYIGLAKEGLVEGVTYQTQISVGNPTADDLTFEALPIVTNRDGTLREELRSAERFTVPKYQTRIFDLPDNWLQQGGAQRTAIIEIQADERLVFQAQVIPTVNGVKGLPDQLPVISQDSLVPGGSTAYLQGLTRNGPIHTNVGVVNLSHETNPCTYDLVRFDGNKMMPSTTLPHLPLSQAYFEDVFELIAVESIANARMQVKCAGAFYVAANIVNRDTGAVAYLAPSHTGFSALNIPGQQLACPNGAECFDQPGVFFIPSGRQPNQRLIMPVAPGNVRRVVVHLDVQHTGWQGEGGDRYAIFWMVLEKNEDMVGYVLFVQPEKVRLRHGFNQNNFQKPNITRDMPIVPGATYSFDYVYDVGKRDVHLVVSQGGTVVQEIRGGTNVGNINVGPNQRFLFDMSFDGHSGAEPPSYGWRYQNLHVEFHR